MAKVLRDTISNLAETFAASVLNAIRQMSLDEILAEAQRTGGTYAQRGPSKLIASPSVPAASASVTPSKGRRKGGGRLARRSQDQIDAVADSIVALLEKHPKGLRSEQIRGILKLDRKEIPRPIQEALSSNKITSEGQKRATTYFARSGGAKSTAKKK
jgi:uncharacterized protein YejL (UPF0352 family)